MSSRSSSNSSVSYSSSSSKSKSSSSSTSSRNNGKRNKFGVCVTCSEPNTHTEWCQPCNSKRFCEQFKNWTSGNDSIDNFIKDAQLSATNSRQVLEWIPYDKFRNFKFVARGGFADVHSAVWKDGFISKWNHEKNDWERMNNWRIALKTLHHSTKLKTEFFDEIKACVQCGGGFGLIRCYGISQNPETGDFIIVLYYAHCGNLRTYLNKHYGGLDWKQKLVILKQIAEGLNRIHQAGFVHRDFHSGNILHSKNAEIADLGLTGPANKSYTLFSSRAIYGVLPYVSPEVLRGKKYTTAADIYSFGIVMWEVSECIPPFSDRAHDCHLALDICRGLRPTFEGYVPKPFTKLVDRCLDAKAEKRPKAQELYEILHKWYWYLREDEENEITKAFNAADHDCSQLSTPVSSRPVTETHPLAIYTSRLLNFPNLPEAINAPAYRRSISITGSINIITDEEDTGYVTRQFEEDLVYVPEGVTFEPEGEKDITRQFENLDTNNNI